MKKILTQTPSGGISFLDLLLDETLCEGEIVIDKSLVVQADGINSYLTGKQKYELLLRIAATGNIEFCEETAVNPAYIILGDDITTQTSWQTDCYIVGKYSSILREITGKSIALKENQFDELSKLQTGVVRGI